MINAKSISGSRAMFRIKFCHLQ